MNIDKILIKKVDNENKVKAYVNFVINDCFVVCDVRIIEGKDRLFIAMPSKKDKKGFRDICHPITKSFRQELEKLIIDEYIKLD